MSWPDRLIGRIGAAPGPSGVAYLAIFGARAMLGHAAGWLGVAIRPGTLDPLVLVQASFPGLTLAILAVGPPAVRAGMPRS